MYAAAAEKEAKVKRPEGTLYPLVSATFVFPSEQGGETPFEVLDRLDHPAELAAVAQQVGQLQLFRMFNLLLDFPQSLQGLGTQAGELEKVVFLLLSFVFGLHQPRQVLVDLLTALSKLLLLLWVTVSGACRPFSLKILALGVEMLISKIKSVVLRQRCIHPNLNKVTQLLTLTG